jgi:hypothetical protein
MSNEDEKKLLEAIFYKNELDQNKRSVDALISLLEHKGTSHPQYNQLDYLKNRNKEIEKQLISLNEIINNLKAKI